MRLSTTPAVLVLEDGRTFTGSAYGAVGETVGEAVFVTAMSGYQETLTDPSYHRQIVIQTAPHIGNTGINAADDESRQIWVSGYVVRDASRISSNWRSEGDLETHLAEAGVVGIKDVDTRALTRHLRDKGAMRMGIFSGPAAEADPGTMLETVLATPPMAGSQLADEVSVSEPELVPAVGEAKFSVAAVDLGIKAMTPQRLAERGIDVHVVPASVTFEEIRALGVDGVFFSNGPGDPATADEQVALLREVLGARIPFFGICFGNQLLGRALGFGTFKLPFGHRGINVPVIDRTTDKVEITAQNHGFAVDAPLEGETTAPADPDFGRVVVSHVCLNDDVVEGLQCLDIPAFSVQFHPEAAAGPHDSDYLFDRFVDLMSSRA
ncbi:MULTISPECIES: glutamine-hydrolyzing carbamoyl-phosphate synthase small subunit [Brevibacterium]|uniref:Carbamoyl phosphate synthase small chain n=2 Tax=Brevibacterium casei TaxID=33889 RepID=K9AKT2_9MICO|nr:glutamine-hydrolyzing carbamoyl-phosphate synthase small subunit [Brevibacterium casei]SIJ53819.1 carbamoyl-phosphate synthase small chain CarA [Mycobacteroides abscessus subsp. abscessus]EKU47933.1 carbamoyl phosphate synthase small subunit [Brevibacterium casei S18]KZE18170.1 carbamoyl-phosphate synthase small subunit [Brevibacterium casei]MBE4693951.1 glutamine-hydrolyzing carbamoyl-phosphate synthase small subunit [Brevibacterium casei]MBY3577074.1 glutamine-hydrolyzing carbamoyl-phosph